jgi:hypothetical protein
MIKKGFALLAPLLLTLLLLTSCGGTTQAKTQPARVDLKKLTADLFSAKTRGQLDKPWAYVHPRYKRVVSRAFYDSCLRKQLARLARYNYKLLSTDTAEVHPFRMSLPPFGMIKVYPVTVTAHIEAMGQKKTDTNTEYWTRVKGQWRTVWAPSMYFAAVKHRCPN